MYKSYYLLLICLLLRAPTVSSQDDWLIDNSTYVSRVVKKEKEITLSNGLISRTIKLSPNATTIAFDNLMTGESIIRGVKPEALLTINGKSYEVGGLQGQPNYAFLDPDWIDDLVASDSAFQLESVDVGETQMPFDWKRTRHVSGTAGSWPPKGASLHMTYQLPEKIDPSLRDLSVVVHYEIYDGIPVLCKWLTIENEGAAEIVINSFTSELLAAVEYSISVDGQNTNLPPANIHVETDYAFSSMEATDANKHVVHWIPDPQYKTQVNYKRDNPCLLKVSPEVGPEKMLSPGDSLQSFRCFILPYDSYERERQGLAQRRMYRTVAPWTTENPLMMHVRFADWESVKLAIDQAAEVGFEMLILTFGSGFNIEDNSSEYLEQMKKYSAYARSKGLEIGGYSLLASRSISPEHDVVYPEGEKPVFNQSPCIGSEWGAGYLDKLYHFFEESGFTLLEHDGSYPGDICISTSHPGHRGYDDSRWNQYKVISDFYKWCRSKGIYLNIPDYYYMTGGNKCGMGYRETNWSLPRAQQVIHTRQNIYDGTWTKTGSMGWMFVPLTEYHGGGSAATIEPLDQHLDHYEQMMMSNLSAGAQACYRGPRLYDTERTKEMVKNRVSWYKKHRDVLEGDLIHLQRADGRHLDYWLMVNPDGVEKGALVVFNPTNANLRKKIRVPLYYTGLIDKTLVYSDQDEGQEYQLDRHYEINLDVQVDANKWSVYFFK